MEWLGRRSWKDGPNRQERKEEILARLEAWEKENKDEELEPEKKEAKETKASRKEAARNASPWNRELTEVTSNDESTE